jgi:hypothetical protein
MVGPAGVAVTLVAVVTLTEWVTLAALVVKLHVGTDETGVTSFFEGHVLTPHPFCS